MPNRGASLELSRRQLLIGVAGAGLGVGGLASCARDTPRSAAEPSKSSSSAGPTQQIIPSRHHYGAGPSQFGDLYLPVKTRGRGVVVIIHGGFWLAQYDLSYGAPLAHDLAGRGYAAFNLEYRRVGDGGGWPRTLEDVAAGLDMLASLPVDISRVVLVGHSAGGQLAAWAAGRPALSAGNPGAGPKVTATAAVCQAGVLDLRTAQEQQVGGTAVPDFLGGTAAQVPGRYRIADPIERIPLPVPVLCVHSRDDQVVPYNQSEDYVHAASSAGESASLITVTGDHFTLIDPTSAAWLTVVERLPALLGR